MKTITSRDNPVLKAARLLHTRKGREEADALLVAGQKLINEAVSAGFEVDHVFINAGALLRGEAASGTYEKEIELEEKLFCELAEIAAPQPYMAVVKRDKGDGPVCLASETNRTVPIVLPKRVLVLDRVQDPGNVGMMLRSAYAAGMDAVWCVKGTADVYSDKAVRASAGAIFRLQVQDGLAAKDCIALTMDIGARLLVCSRGGTDLYETDLTGSFALVIGNEGTGPQEVFLDAADGIVGIPMAEGAESLNAAAAAVVVMYEARRQSGENF